MRAKIWVVLHLVFSPIDNHDLSSNIHRIQGTAYEYSLRYAREDYSLVNDRRREIEIDLNRDFFEDLEDNNGYQKVESEIVDLVTGDDRSYPIFRQDNFDLSRELEQFFENKFIHTEAFELIAKKLTQSLEDREQPRAISVILLDAENLKINQNTDRFLADRSTYPLEVKIAFANWSNSSLGDWDRQLYSRGYQLIHVPKGKDAADAKAIAMGSSLSIRDRQIKEVFIGSNDRLLDHLCNELLNQGAIVYQVGSKGNLITLKHLNNGTTKVYSLKDYEPIEDRLESSNLIQQKLDSQDSKIADILEKLLSLDRSIQDLQKQNIQQQTLPGDRPTTETVSSNSSQKVKQEKEATATQTSQFKNEADLATGLVVIIRDRQKLSPNYTIDLGVLGNAFRKKYGQSLADTLKGLKFAKNLTQFCEKRSEFRLDKSVNPYRIYLQSQDRSQQKQSANSLVSSNSAQSTNISSKSELERILQTLVVSLSQKQSEKTVYLSVIGTEFQKKYNKSLSSFLVKFGMSKKVLSFFKTSPKFKVHQTKNNYKISLS